MSLRIGRQLLSACSSFGRYSPIALFQRFYTPSLTMSTENKDTMKNEEVKTTASDVKVEEETKKPYYLGAHVSSAGGSFNAVINANKIGATAFALFLKSQRQWAMPAITDKAVEQFKEEMKKYNYKPEVVLPHGSYLCNIGSPDPELYEKARNAMLEECKRVELLGLTYLNVHPGSTAKKCTKEESIQRIAEAINYIHQNTSYMTIVLENTAGGGGTVGVDFKELKSIIDKVENKQRVGVCIDTCHAYASGINIASPTGVQRMVKEFDEVIGLSYLKAMHLNDSTGELASNRDVHQPLGAGTIGLDAFRQIMNCDALRGIPLILETPWSSDEYGPEHGWAKEIVKLQGLIGVEKVDTPKKGIAMMFAKKGGKKKDEEKKEKKTDEKPKKTVKAAKTAKSAKSVKGKKTGKKTHSQSDSESVSEFESSEMEN